MREKKQIGLWKNDKFKNYGCSTPVEIGGETYWVNLYKNDRKTEDRQPDLNLVLVPADPRRETESAGSQDEFQDGIPF